MPRRKVADMSDPVNRLDAAIDDLKYFRRKWEALGRPEFDIGSKGQLVAHPLIRLIRDAERAVLMLDQAVPKRPGRPQGSSSAPDRRRLRVVPLASAPSKRKTSGSGKS